MREKYATVVMTVSAVACLFWLVALGWVFQNQFFRTATGDLPVLQQVVETETANVKDEPGMDILALGDSLTRGSGDYTGNGYVGNAIEQLSQEVNEEIRLHNFAVEGLTSVELVELLEQSEIQRQAQSAEMIVMTIGGNDLNQRGQTLLEMDEEKIAGHREAFVKNLDYIMSELRTLNPDAPIYLLGFYNPFNDLGDGETTSRIVREWNQSGEAVIAKYDQVIFVPVFDLFQIDVGTVLAADLFHPNQAGYRLMADRLVPLLVRGVSE